ncbi:ABC transporter permease [Clostridium estertheticum]|uniref:ABC transporter permease n=1 Tax=Clostridium estertheticum TaxID=238834 RepID=UPI0013E99B64|nr:ABC transporter permease [Clostridium estertheticum]MBZ9685477.1 ABC transporter permease [Clostridium estertheticum]
MDYIRILISTKMKLIMRKKILILLSILAPLIALMFVDSIFTRPSFFNKVPIAVIDEDNSVTSKRIVAELSNSSSLKCTVIKKTDINKNLNDNFVQGVYILNSGLEENIEKQKFDKLVTVHYLPHNVFAPGITDVIASQLLYYVCAVKSASTGEESMSKNDDIKVYDDIIMYNLNHIDDPNFNLPLKINSISPNTKVENTAITKGDIVSKQFSLGMVIILSTLFLLSGCATIMKTRSSGVYKRIKVAGVPYSYLLLSDVISIMLSGSFVVLLQFSFLYKVMDMQDAQIFGLVILSCLIYMFCMSNFFVLLTRIFKSHISFQSIMPVFILFMGLLSGCLWSMELMPQKIIPVAHLMPTYWIHNAITNLILYNGNIGDITLNLIFLIGYGIVFMIINFITEKNIVY